MTKLNNDPKQLVFGLDIGTRSIVGTVGYLERDRFQVVAQRSKEHETRSMLDGQIHDIGRVSWVISQIKSELEEMVAQPLNEVCIAAAGRVLRTVSVHIEQGYEQEKTVSREDIFALESLGVETAYEQFSEENDTDMRFYCVGYSVVRYFLNNYPIGNLENHKAKNVSADLIATFLPDDVVDGLYKAVELAGLQVANLTLEPIAAIQVAIPEMYRMLNIALVDVGAGTSDISITKDGSITAYGMIPIAGDTLTECISQQCLVDFQTAEQIKRDAGVMDVIEYKDIMMLPQKITKEEFDKLVEPVLKDMTKQVADKIKELNGDKSVSAVFVVGGGAKIPGYTELLAEELGIQQERVALRGEEVMQKIDFLEKNVKKDSLLVTPIGICLTYYLQANSFVFVNFNGERIKLYDNSKLAVVDAAMHVGFPNDALFPKRGKELNIIVNGKPRIIRGMPGEAAVITVNDEPADIHTAIKAGDNILVKASTAGADAHSEIRFLPEYNSALSVMINDKKVELPKFASVNGGLQSGYYAIQDGDDIQMLNYYTVKQILEFMDVQIDTNRLLLVNNVRADMDTRVYENFSVTWTLSEEQLLAYEESLQNEEEAAEPGYEDTTENMDEQDDEDTAEDTGDVFFADENGDGSEANDADSAAVTENADGAKIKDADAAKEITLQVIANGVPVEMTGKPDYIFVDIFDYIDFDLSVPKGSGVETKRNGKYAQYMEKLENGDVLEIYWKE